MATNDTNAGEVLIDIKLPVVQVLIFQGFDELDAIGPYEVLSGAGFAVGFLGWDAQDGKIEGAHGIGVHVGQQFDPDPGVFIVPGGGWLMGQAYGAW
jgi:putative intracellular protease/amidase